MSELTLHNGPGGDLFKDLIDVVVHGREFFLKKLDAIVYLNACRVAGYELLGIEQFVIKSPDIIAVADFGADTSDYDEAIRFIENTDDFLVYNGVREDRFYNVWISFDFDNEGTGQLA
jgi:hypothetical protein